MGEIYQIKNDFNNKVYIGKTVKNMTTRKAQHLAQLHDGTAIHNSILKHGIEHFTWEVIEKDVPKEELAEREKYWINYFDSYYNGYNMTKGGEGGNGTHAKNLENWRKQNPEMVQKNIKNLQKWQESHPQEVKQANLKGAKTRLKKYGNEITKKANQATKKKVRCIETGKIYNSAKEAAQDIGGANGSHIGQVCNKKRKTAYNLHWEWAN